MDPQLLRAKAGFADTVSAARASDIYTICLHATQHSPLFFPPSVVVALNICHLVGRSHYGTAIGTIFYKEGCPSVNQSTGHLSQPYLCSGHQRALNL